MDAITALHTRLSVPRLTEPGPDAAQMELLLKAALRAPDHGVVRPWRFVVVEGQDRQRLGEVFVRAQLLDDPDSDQAALDKVAGNPLRAPTILVVVAETDPVSRVPVIDQIMAVAAAAQNIMVAAHALDLGAMWRTGRMAEHPLVKQQLGFADKDEIVGYLYLGTPAPGTRKALPEESPAQYVRSLPQ